ncbi:MAG: cobalt-precorrin-5B (C(1))-methyltransferase [Pseudomonadota bacterium]
MSPPSHRRPETPLRRGWTTGACATAATQAALELWWTRQAPKTVSVTLPKGDVFSPAVLTCETTVDGATASIVKDAGDDPDVTHGATITVAVRRSTGGVVFCAGEGVGTVTKPGLPIAVGEPAINPVPRAMMDEVVAAMAATHAQKPDVEITVSVAGGAALAEKTWNPRLGIKGGISILGTTGIVRPFSCAAWIASIHRGIDVARADGLTHVAGCTGSTSEATVQSLYGLPDHAMLDMGDFAGGMLKYLSKHPIAHVTIGGGIGKITKLAQGAVDLHSARSQVDFADLAQMSGVPAVADANTALAAYEMVGAPLARMVAQRALAHVQATYPALNCDIVIVDRAGQIIGQAGL